MAEIIITQSQSDTRVTEKGRTDTYKIRLASIPSSAVTLNINTDDQTLITKNGKTSKRAIKIMPVGDSITYGVINSRSNTQSGGYRTYLWQLLKADGYRVDFVGSQTNGPTSIDRNHEGYRGQTIASIGKLVNRQIERKQPDVVLLLAGTNDINQDKDLSDAPKRLSALIEQIREEAPGVTVLVGTLPPNTKSSANPQRVQDFNAAIFNLINRKVQHHEKVALVDLYGDLSNRDLSDRVHLTAKGYKKMAQTWYETLIGVLNSPDFLPLSDTQRLTFTPRNWNVPQTITVVATDNDQAEGNHISVIRHTANSIDASYNNLAKTLTLTVRDDDPGVSLRPVDDNNLLEGETKTYRIALTSKPTAAVSVRLTTDNQLSLSQSKFTFTPTNWNQARNVTVAATNTSIVEGAHSGVITRFIRSRDPKYGVLAADKITIDIDDDDIGNEIDDDMDNNQATSKAIQSALDTLVSSSEDSGIQSRSSNKNKPQLTRSSLLVGEYNDDLLNVAQADNHLELNPTRNQAAQGKPLESYNLAKNEKTLAIETPYWNDRVLGVTAPEPALKDFRSPSMWSGSLNLLAGSSPLNSSS